MSTQRCIVLIAVAALLAASCGSELRRALDDVIDKREAEATRQVQVYKAFEGELTEELAMEWGARPEDGCPVAADLPPIPTDFELCRAVGTNCSAAGYNRHRDEINALREEALESQAQVYDRNIPAYHCDCVQRTIVSVRRAIAQRDPSQFEREREELAEVTEEELLLMAPFVRDTANQYAADATRHVDTWKTRRYGEDGESGWQTAHERGERWNVFGGCDRF